jgi:macrolide transport system ATP-binding/permease protein
VVAVIDERMWRRRFDGRADIAGQTIRMAGREFEIVGVAPSGFHGVEFPNLVPTVIWVPLEAAAVVGATGGIGVGADFHENREHRFLVGFGRLAPGRSIAQSQADLQVIARRLDETFPIGVDLPRNQRSPPNISRPWTALPAADRLVSEQADPSILRMASLTMVAVTLVLLVACTNLANLMLARGVAQKRDLAVRLALGASRWQVVREQLVESAIVAALGAGAALIAARLLTAYGSGITLRLGAWVTVEVSPALDLPVALVGAAATVLALIVFGLVPAIQLTAREARLVGGSGVAGGDGTGWRGRRWLIASQVAVSVALVAIASLCARHVVAAASGDTGVDLDRLALVRFDFNVQDWSEARATGALERIAQAAGRQPGTESVAVVSGLPLRGLGRSTNLTTPDRPFTPRYYGQGVTWIAGTPALFRTLGVPILAGRPFDERDDDASAAAIVLSERAARGLFDTTDVVGRQVIRRRPHTVRSVDGIETLTVVGVARDTGNGDGSAAEGAAYVPLSQHFEPFLTIAARTERDPRAAVLTLENLSHQLEPELGVIDAGTGGALRGVENIAFEIMGALSGLLGVVAMALAMAGLYGVLSYVVVQRTHEIGVRVALGASTKQIMRLVLIDGVRPVIEGLIIGFVIADLAEMAMRPALARPLPAIDATMLALVPVPFLIAALIACYLPSRRAAGVDPNIALRHS